jgi:hypothetical protein
MLKVASLTRKGILHCRRNPIRLPHRRKTWSISSLSRAIGVLLLFALVSCNAHAQAQQSPLFDPVPTTRPELQDPAFTRRATLGLIIGNAAVVGLYGKRNWWEEGFAGGFHTQKEGWFGPNTYSGGADKLGHLYLNYASTRLFSRAFEEIGNSPEKSRQLAAWLMLGTFTAVEVLDGFSRQWSFSQEDALMNVAGVGLALLLETQPALDRLLDFRIHYWPSSGSNFNPFGDYSGQTYLLAVKASGVPGWRDRPLLRYLEFAVGYGTRGYTGQPNAPGMRGERNIYVGISLNLSALLDDKVFRQSGERSTAQRITQTALEFVQVPGTVVSVKHSLD